MPTQRKRIAVIGDCMWDKWTHGKLLPSQDGVHKFVADKTIITPGGAANAARQLTHWDVDTYLIGHYSCSRENPWGFRTDLLFNKCVLSQKERFIDETGRIVSRIDTEFWKTSKHDFETDRDLAIKAVRTMNFDGVLISDYDKGFLDRMTIQEIIGECNRQKIPVVCDAKRAPTFYVGSILKCNEDYAKKHLFWANHEQKVVVTRGGEIPRVYDLKTSFYAHKQLPVQCVNHVGAGDCFAAHLTFFLAGGYQFDAAVRTAHSAGRVFVQYLYSRPPWPHEVWKDLHGVWGFSKGLSEESFAASLRQSLEGKKIIFTNGVFRIPHAGHAWLLKWAKSQGDILVVGINGDESAQALRPGEFVLPLQERIEMLSGLECVDWIIPFSEPDPCEVIRQLKPDFLVKGSEYVGQKVPGDDLTQVLFAPESPYPAHSSDLVAALRL